MIDILCLVEVALGHLTYHVFVSEPLRMFLTVLPYIRGFFFGTGVGVNIQSQFVFTVSVISTSLNCSVNMNENNSE